MPELPVGRVLRTPADQPDPAVVTEAGAVLRAGGLVAIPTETVYGLGCNALDPGAVQRVFDAKQRPASDPLIVHVDGIAMVSRVTGEPLPTVAATLAEAFWPGPLTLVVPRGAEVPDAVTSGLADVGIRCPSHPVAAAIITAADRPIAAPSANRFGRISPTSADHVIAELGDRCNLVIDAGRTLHGVESTVVAIRDDTAVVLRHGAVTVEALQRHVAVAVPERADATTAAVSPGHDARHYSPATPSVAATAGAARAAGSQQPDGRSVVWLGYTDRQPALPTTWRFEPLGALTDLDAVAHDLYDTLRRLDADAPDLLVVELTDAAGLGRAIDDRLTRAASSRVASTGEELSSAIAAAMGPFT